MSSLPPKYRLVYGGTDSFSDDDGRSIILKLCLPLASVFRNSACNLKVLTLFTSSGVFGVSESDELRINYDSLIPLDWTIKFCELLKNRYEVYKALNLLLNLDSDTDLSNYQDRIRSAFKAISADLPKILRIEIESITPENSPGSPIQHTIPRNDTSSSITVEPDVTKSLLSSTQRNHHSRINCCNKYSSVNDFMKKNPKMTKCIALSAILVGISGLTGCAIIINTTRNDLINNAINTPTQKENAALPAFKDSKEVTVNYTGVKSLWLPNKIQESASEMAGSSVSLKTGTTITTPPLSLNAVAENRKVKDEQNESPFTVMAAENKSSTTTSSTTPIQPQEQTPTPGHSKVTPKDKFQRQLYINAPTDIKHKTAELCDPNYETTLVVDIEHHYDWHGVEIDCGGRVYKLKVVEGYPSIQNLDEILTQTLNIRYLHIQCNRVSIGFPEKTKKLELKKLKSLKLSSDNVASDCFEALSYLAANVNFTNLKKLDIDKITITDKTKPEILRIMSKMSSSSLVEINLSDIIMKTFVNISSKMKDFNYARFSLNLHNVSPSEEEAEVALKTVVSFLNNTKYLKDFSSNVALPDKQMPKILKQFIRLQVRKLFAIVQVKEGRTRFSFNFIKSLKQLESLDLKLVGWEQGNASQSCMLLTDFTSLSESLKEFKVSTDFESKALGANNIHCRAFQMSKNSRGGISIVMNVCSDCNDQVGCMRRRKRSERLENKNDRGTVLS